MEVITFLSQHWEGITSAAIGLYEIIVRRTPTKRDYSIINWGKAVIDFVVKNKTHDGGTRY